MNVTKESENPTEVTLSISMDTADEEPFLTRFVPAIGDPCSDPGISARQSPPSHS